MTTEMPPLKFAMTNGIRMGYYEAGPVSDTPPLVLCHGWPEIAFSWRHQIKALAAAGIRVIAPDQRACGATAGPDAVEGYDLEHLTADLVGLLDHLKIEKVIFVGHDWGGFIVWQMPLRHPSRVVGVIGVNTPYTPRAPVDPIQIFRKRFGERAPAIGQEGGKKWTAAVDFLTDDSQVRQAARERHFCNQLDPDLLAFDRLLSRYLFSVFLKRNRQPHPQALDHHVRLKTQHRGRRKQQSLGPVVIVLHILHHHHQHEVDFAGDVVGLLRARVGQQLALQRIETGLLAEIHLHANDEGHALADGVGVDDGDFTLNRPGGAQTLDAPLYRRCGQADLRTQALRGDSSVLLQQRQQAAIEVVQSDRARFLHEIIIQCGITALLCGKSPPKSMRES